MFIRTMPKVELTELFRRHSVREVLDLLGVEELQLIDEPSSSTLRLSVSRAGEWREKVCDVAE